MGLLCARVLLCHFSLLASQHEAQPLILKAFTIVNYAKQANRTEAFSVYYLQPQRWQVQVTQQKCAAAPSSVFIFNSVFRTELRNTQYLSCMCETTSVCFSCCSGTKSISLFNITYFSHMDPVSVTFLPLFYFIMLSTFTTSYV